MSDINPEHDGFRLALSHFPAESYRKDPVDDVSMRFVHDNPVLFAKLSKLVGLPRHSWEVWYASRGLYNSIISDMYDQQTVDKVVDVLAFPFPPIAEDFNSEELTAVEALPKDASLSFVIEFVPTNLTISIGAKAIETTVNA